MRFLYFFGLLFFVSFLTASGQDGVLEPSFGNNGSYIYSVISVDGRATSYALLSDGSIIMGCYVEDGRHPFYIILTSSGSPETSFGIIGVLTLPQISPVSNNWVAGQSNSKIIAAYSISNAVTFNNILS